MQGERARRPTNSQPSNDQRKLPGGQLDRTCIVAKQPPQRVVDPVDRAI